MFPEVEIISGNTLGNIFIMQIWMDGDACPNPIKQILYRTAVRTNVLLTVVANQLITTPLTPYIKRHQVVSGFDAADQYIVLHLQAGDLVITADIPLADEVVDKGGWALNPRGELYSKNNIKQCLSQRNHNETLRGSGMIMSGPNQFGAKDIQRFANQLDKFLAKRK
jgi:hypothetical protein